MLPLQEKEMTTIMIATFQTCCINPHVNNLLKRFNITRDIRYDTPTDDDNGGRISYIPIPIDETYSIRVGAAGQYVREIQLVHHHCDSTTKTIVTTWCDRNFIAPAMHVDEDVGEYHVDMVYSAYIDDVEKQYYLLK